MLSLTRLHLLGDWIKLKMRVDTSLIMQELASFDSHWKKYNPRKDIKRSGLSVTSFDGQLSGIPDLDSLSEYNKENGTSFNNFTCTVATEVFHKSKELQRILHPFKDHLLRTHFIRLDAGGYFPPHRDCFPEDPNSQNEQIRLLFLIKNCGSDTFKFLYQDHVMPLNNGECYYFNGNKTHSVFSMKDNCIFLVANLRFDNELYAILTKEMNDQ